MRTIFLNKETKLEAGAVATIGFFDGVHRGHQYLIKHVVDEARRRGLLAMVVTFAEHPRQVLQPEWHPQLLSTLEEKRILLAQTGIDVLVVLPFDVQMASLSGRVFMELVLKAQLGVEVLYMGYDNRFGHDRADGFEQFVAYGEALDIEVRQGEPFDAQGVRVSSSFVRRCISEGDVARAAQCLGHPYMLLGHVVRGEHVGTGLGFPTANMQLDEPLKLVPAPGAYAVRVRIDGSMAMRAGMMNIGTRPTFDGHEQTLETHIFQFEDHLYGQRMGVFFVDKLRDEHRFATQEKLVAQLCEDAERAAALLAVDER